MASGNASIGGYDCQFLQEPPDDLKCLICLSVAKEPVQHGGDGCGRIYCKQCISLYQKIKNKCPSCRKSIVTFKDVRSERDIQSLKVKCHNSPCTWTGELRSLAKHITICNFVMIPCPNKCTQRIRKRPIDSESTLENVKVFRKDMKQHLATDCERRQYKCPYCHETDEYRNITGFHKRLSCKKIPLKCENHGCKKTFLREAQKDHTSICPYEEVPCKYKEFGCDTEPCRKDLKDHESNTQLHLHVTMDTLLAVQRQCQHWSRECSALQAQLNTTAKQSHRITFKMNLIVKDDEFLSPPFFSHPEGYKLIIKVGITSDGLVVRIYLMRGEFDSQLEFPFEGTVTVAILNQLQDAHHIQQSHIQQSLRLLCSGCERALEHDINLFSMASMNFKIDQFRATTGRKYLKDNAFIFRVSVEVPSFKPWLYCADT